MKKPRHRANEGTHDTPYDRQLKDQFMYGINDNAITTELIH